MRRFLLLSVAAILLCACGTNRPDASKIQQWIGASVVLPDDLAIRADGRDTVWTALDTATSARIVVYYDAEGCTPCKLKELLQWKSLIETCNSEKLPVRFVFILNTGGTPRQELDRTVYSMRFTHPVLIDTADSFERHNPQLPDEALFHTFLLDRENRVVLVGSPIGRPKMWELYKRTIEELAAQDNMIFPNEQE